MEINSYIPSLLPSNWKPHWVNHHWTTLWLLQEHVYSNPLKMLCFSWLIMSFWERLNSHHNRQRGENDEKTYGSSSHCRSGSLNQGFYKSKCFHHVEPDCSSDICSVSEGFVWNEEKFWMWNTLTKWKTQIKKLSPLHHRFCCKSPRIPRQPRKSEFLKGGFKPNRLQKYF